VTSRAPGARDVACDKRSTGAKRHLRQGPQAACRRLGPGGLLVADGAAGLGAHSHAPEVDNLGRGLVAAAAVLEGTTLTHALSSAKGPDRSRAPGGSRGLCAAPLHRAVDTRRAGGQSWAGAHARACQRASSAVEGRNGSLSQMHHNHRGLPMRRYHVWTVLHNVDCRAADGTTPAARFFRRAFPDLFESVLSQIGELPLPRQRRQAIAVSDGGYKVSRTKRIPDWFKRYEVIV